VAAKAGVVDVAVVPSSGRETSVRTLVVGLAAAAKAVAVAVEAVEAVAVVAAAEEEVDSVVDLVALVAEVEAAMVVQMALGRSRGVQKAKTREVVRILSGDSLQQGF
jgi:hypothetical protein